MEKSYDREIYFYLKQIPGFDNISNIQDFLDFLEKNRFSIVSKISENLFDILSVNIILDELTDSQKKIIKNHEVFLIVDKNDKILLDSIGLPIVDFRKNCHIPENIENSIHRVSDFLVINEKKEILLGNRSNLQDSYGGFVSILGGHCGILDYKEALKREFKEELGLDIDKYKYRKLKKYMYGDNQQSQFVTMYEVSLDSSTEFKVDFNELDGIKWYNINELIELMNNKNIKIIPHEQYLILEYIKVNNLNEEGVNIDKMLELALKKMQKEKIYIK